MTNPIVTIEMENGDIMKAELYPEVAPNTVNNFVSLVKKGYYDGLIFHRVINGFIFFSTFSPTFHSTFFKASSIGIFRTFRYSMTATTA